MIGNCCFAGNLVSTWMIFILCSKNQTNNDPKQNPKIYLQDIDNNQNQRKAGSGFFLENQLVFMVTVNIRECNIQQPGTVVSITRNVYGHSYRCSS